MKKGLSLILITLLMLSLGAAVFAGGQQDAAGKDEFVIGWSNAGMGDSWRQFLKANFEAEVAANPEIVKYYISDANERPEKQIADIDDLLAKGVDGLIIYPTVGDAIIPAVERAYESGIPVIVFGGSINTDSLTCLVTQDLYEFGRSQAKWLAEELGGKGKIIMLSGIAGNTTAEERLAGAREVFDANPGIEVLDHQYCDWSAAKTKTIVEAMLNAFPEIDGIWADSGLMSWPALQAFEEAGRKLVPSTGDQLNGYAKYVSEKNVPAYLYPMSTRLSAEAVKVLVAAMKGETVDKKVAASFEGMGPEAIKKFVKPELSDWWWVGDDQMPAEFLPRL
ncbi:MAG: ABC transporter substrate-binding protein [Spirochaetales bacterium]|nr:ABC transporter substrate-binding protein [Spirochaetales bacterium]